MLNEESRETRLREGDRRHAVGCAAAQADRDRGCKYKRVSGGPGERFRMECGEGFFDDERMLPGRLDWANSGFGPGARSS
jgi:hypothetical protein